MPFSHSPFILGTRGSELALTQARLTEAALRATGFTGAVVIRIIQTIGDKRPDLKLAEFSQTGGQDGAPLLDKGIFTKELEEALLRQEIHAAVHSLKDVPTEISPAFALAATLPRAPIEDVLITHTPCPGGLRDLPQGATVATSSVRRARQARWLRPDLTIVDIRGNVPTRLRKLAETPNWQGLLLARAGLERLGFLARDAAADQAPLMGTPHDLHVHTLDPTDFLPAAGQGAIAIECRSDDAATRGVLERICDWPTYHRVMAERAFLARLGAGCQTPVGMWTTLTHDRITLQARVFDETDPQATPREGSHTGPDASPTLLAEALHQTLFPDAQSH